jgi:hypothetical protein
MTNNQITNNELDKMVRARSLYITSDTISFDADVGNAIYQLQDPITSQDGFDLVYGVRAFGFNASAMNISRQQRNNILSFETTMIPPAFIYNTTTKNFDTNLNRTEITSTYHVHYPDGLYTMDQLFNMLSNDENYSMFSGYQTNITYSDPIFFDVLNGTSQVNNLYIKPLFQRADGGFTVQPVIAGLQINNRYYNSNFTTRYYAYQVNFVLTSFKIKKNSSNPGLYNLLFTNKFTDSSDHAPMVPQFETIIKGHNPPIEIEFLITNNLYWSENDPALQDNVTPSSSMIFTVVYKNDEHIISNLTEKYPSNGFTQPNRPARFYHLPDINPLYVDVLSDLPTLSMSSDGNKKGILVRQFAIGGDNGGTSFFQQYDNPIFYRTSSSKENIDSIRINFVSEGNKWSFFNLDFFLELVIFEYKQEAVNNPFPSDERYKNSSATGNSYHMPTEDEITSAMGPTHNSFPFRHLGNNQSVVYFSDNLESKLKRRR